MSNLYHDLIIDHYKNPRNFGVLENPDATAQEANASCGDMVEFQIKVIRVQSSEFRVQKIAWRGVGCAISTAAASLLSGRVQSSGFRVQNILNLTDKDMVKMLGGEISPTRIKCATLALKALQKALKSYQSSEKRVQSEYSYLLLLL